METAYPETNPPRSAQVLAVIAAFKLVKAAACTLLAVLAFRLLQPAFAATLEQWLESLRWLTRFGFAVRLIDHLLGLGPQRFLLFGSMATGYALLYLVQGIGLWRGRRWAEYLVVVESSLLLPLEIWELAHRFTAFKFGLLLANLAVVAYLARLLYRTRVR